VGEVELANTGVLLPETSSRFAAADERRVIVVEFMRNVAWFGRHDKFNFTHQITAPVSIHLGAKLAAHRFELDLPRLAVGSNFQTTGSASHRARVRRDGGADDCGPHTRKPRYRGFGALQLPQHAA
jgi:hypothetical protein